MDRHSLDTAVAFPYTAVADQDIGAAAAGFLGIVAEVGTDQDSHLVSVVEVACRMEVFVEVAYRSRFPEGLPAEAAVEVLAAAAEAAFVAQVAYRTRLEDCPAAEVAAVDHRAVAIPEVAAVVAVAFAAEVAAAVFATFLQADLAEKAAEAYQAVPAASRAIAIQVRDLPAFSDLLVAAAVLDSLLEFVSAVEAAAAEIAVEVAAAESKAVALMVLKPPTMAAEPAVLAAVAVVRLADLAAGPFAGSDVGHTAQVAVGHTAPFQMQADVHYSVQLQPFLPPSFPRRFLQHCSQTHSKMDPYCHPVRDLPPHYLARHHHRSPLVRQSPRYFRQCNPVTWILLPSLVP